MKNKSLFMVNLGLVMGVIIVFVIIVNKPNATLIMTEYKENYLPYYYATCFVGIEWKSIL
ncbi:hypothetical protein GCM10011378_39070 [Hymenobacter glacieicola]|uniref:Uncharacterized protein n=1 Tax=Hymenobacter glacieicola TaxID=1562124 RepID=A0ABQ1X492_9BACT|nr:hypothetical protein GCM10011378_39070 [Hymenobacter glacieicola]